MGNDDDSGCSTEEYAWVPPGVSGELVSIPKISADSLLTFIACKRILALIII